MPPDGVGAGPNPLRFSVGSLAELVNLASGDWAAARFPIAGSKIALPLAANGRCRHRQRGRVEPWCFGER